MTIITGLHQECVLSQVPFETFMVTGPDYVASARSDTQCVGYVWECQLPFVAVDDRTPHLGQKANILDIYLLFAVHDKFQVFHSMSTENLVFTLQSSKMRQ